MGDDAVQRLNEAVLPVKFSLESLQRDESTAASQRFGLEGWSPDNGFAAPTGAAWETAKGPISRGSLPLITEGNTQFGLTFGRRDDREQRDEDRDVRTRRGKTLGLYIEHKF